MKFALACLLLALAASTCAGAPTIVARESVRDCAWRPEESRWIREHAGMIFFEDGAAPRYTMTELMDMAHALGLRTVKTWLKGSHEGEMLATLQTPVYKRILRDFDTVHFDVCPDYMLSHTYDDAWGRMIRQEYEGVAFHLASLPAAETGGGKKVFLLSLFMETNLFMGTERADHPDFPAVRFFNDAADGVRAGVARARALAPAAVHPQVYTVIEVGGLPKDYIRRFFPLTHADLYAMSYYGRGELGQPDVTLQDEINYINCYAPHNGPFGKHNLILGELGRSVYGGGNDGDDREQMRYLRKTLATARANGVQYAFIFWITDQDRGPDDGWGFVSLKRTGSVLRRSWHAFQSIWGGSMPDGRPSRPHVIIDAVRPLRFNVKLGERVPVLMAIANRSTWNGDAAPASDVVVRIRAGSEEQETHLSLQPDEVVMLRADVKAPEDAAVTVTTGSSSASAETRTVSLNRADLVVDRVYAEPAEPRAGEMVHLFAIVRNLGNTPITDFAVHFHVDDFKSLWVTWGCIYGETKLAKGQALPIGGGFPWHATTSGTHRIRAWANPDGGRESNYKNNIAYGEVNVSAP